MADRKKPVSLFDLPAPSKPDDRLVGRAIFGAEFASASGEVGHRVQANGEAARFMEQEAALARASRTAAETARLDKQEVRIYEGGERIDRTVAGVKAHDLRALSSLGPALIHTGQVYGGIIEALQATSRTDDFALNGGGVGPRDLGAYIRPIEMGQLRDLAWRVVPATRVAIEPKRRARRAFGDADLGKAHAAKTCKGTMQDKRKVIMARRLIDMICIEGSSLQNVLRVHCWFINGRNRQRLLVSLAECLTDIAVAWNGRDADFGGDWCHDLSQ
ncbi:MAG: hypothetical protein AAF415_02340 [Pseudomonadota bacterium]